MLKSNKSLMILLFCLVMFNVIYRNIQASDEGDVLGLVNMFMMISLAVAGGFYSIRRRDDSKKYGKYGI
ncbi:MAG: hypothetical protein KJO45_02465 [Sulfurovum sp.]|nr:hypothetical protein [Sulfurovum sp.]